MRWFFRSKSDSASKPDDLLSVAEFTQLLASDAQLLRTLCVRAAPVFRGEVQRVLTEFGRRGTSLEEDLVHDLMVEILRDDKLVLRKWDPARGSLRVYLRMLANRRTRDKLRGRSYARSCEKAMDQAEMACLSAADPGQELDSEAHDFWRKYRALFEAHVTPAEQELYQRFYVNEESLEDLAAAMQISAQTLYKRLSRLRKVLFELRDRLLDDGDKEQGNG